MKLINFIIPALLTATAGCTKANTENNTNDGQALSGTWSGKKHKAALLTIF